MGKFSNRNKDAITLNDINRLRLMNSKEANSLITRYTVYCYISRCGVLDKNPNKDDIIQFMYQKVANAILRFTSIGATDDMIINIETMISKAVDEELKK